MPAAAEAIARTQDRHSHISIPLQLRLANEWVRLEAIGWNTTGFNFYDARALASPQLQLKRGLLHFAGALAWVAPNADAAVVRATLVNELIYKQAQSVSSDAALHARLLNLIRVSGMVAQKRQILASLGLDIGEAKMAQLVAKRMRERPTFQYGVTVQSEVWAAVVEKALSMSSAVMALEAWSKSLPKK